MSRPFQDPVASLSSGDRSKAVPAADAVRLANDSVYGLGGSVWTGDHDRAAAIARQVRTGMVGVNAFGPGTDMPFGGFKASGIGREYGAAGLEEYVETKVIHGLRK